MTDSQRDGRYDGFKQPHIWDLFDYGDVLDHVPDSPLPECNRGSWFCPVADAEDAMYLDMILTEAGIDRIYDLGAGDLRFAVDMDLRGYDVVAYETIASIVEFALSRLPENDVQVVQADYYQQWPSIKDDRAAFVSLGRVNSLPGKPSNGLAFDSIAIPYPELHARTQEVTTRA